MADHLDALFADAPEVMKVAEVADILRVREAVVYEWLNKGTITGYQIGRSWRILRDELKDTLRKRSEEEGSSAT